MPGERSKSHVLISYESKNVFVFSSFYCHNFYDWFYCNSSSYIPSLTAYFFVSIFVHVVWTHTVIGSVVISREHFEHELANPFRKRSTSLYVISTSKVRFLPENSLQNTALTKSELSSPVSSVHAWNAWDHDPPFGKKKWLAFSDSGSPAEPE